MNRIPKDDEHSEIEVNTLDFFQSKTFLWINKLIKLPLGISATLAREQIGFQEFCSELLCSFSSEFRNHKNSLQIQFTQCQTAGAAHKKVTISCPNVLIVQGACAR